MTALNPHPTSSPPPLNSRLSARLKLFARLILHVRIVAHSHTAHSNPAQYAFEQHRLKRKQARTADKVSSRSQGRPLHKVLDPQGKGHERPGSLGALLREGARPQDQSPLASQRREEAATRPEAKRYQPPAGTIGRASIMIRTRSDEIITGDAAEGGGTRASSCAGRLREGVQTRVSCPARDPGDKP